MSDFGAPKPLNWDSFHKSLPEYTEKPLTHDEKREKASRNGSPPIRKSAPSKLEPSFTQELNPSLTLGKALLQPVKVDLATGKEQLARKRDEHGKFVDAENSGEESSAADDAAKQERAAKLTQTRTRDKFLGKSAVGNGMSQTLPIADPNAVSQNTMGSTPSGMPIYDDPYHPEHKGFSSEDHQMAAQLHGQQSQMAHESGDPNAATIHSQKATVHSELAKDSQAPMDRVASLGMPQQGAQQPQVPPALSMQAPLSPTKQGIQTLKAINPFDWFFQQQHAGVTGANTAGPVTDFNKPFPGNSDFAPRNGPQPGMFDTRTGGPTGPQTQQGFAGTQPQMPPTPMMANPTDYNQTTTATPVSPNQPQDDFMSQYGGGQTQVATQNMPQSNAPPDSVGPNSEGVEDNDDPKAKFGELDQEDQPEEKKAPPQFGKSLSNWLSKKK